MVRILSRSVAMVLQSPHIEEPPDAPLPLEAYVYDLAALVVP
jgi:hypothetical protein